MVCEENSKSNETSVFAQSCQYKWTFFLDLELEQTLFYDKNLSSWNTGDFTYYVSYIFAIKNFFLLSLSHLSTDSITLESFCS